MEQSEYLDNYERILEDGLVKVATGNGLLDGEMLRCPDVDARWENDFIQPYVADAVGNINSYPDAAVAWAAFLGMAVAHHWDRTWDKNSKAAYESYYGPRGWDDMDEHILQKVLYLKPEVAAKVSDTLLSCASATLDLIRHEGIETQTGLGFYILARSYTVMYRLGASIELRRMGYRKVALR